MVQIGVLGLGTVGTGVVELIELNQDSIAQRLGDNIRVKKIFVKNPNKRRPDIAAGKITYNVEDILNDPEISIVAELMGGEEPALTYIKKALSNGKHVVTANKEIIAIHGKELFELAASNNVKLLFEASVAGGIPIIQPMKKCLIANKISKIMGILNGTTNYILSQMTEKNKNFEAALKEAQDEGYAESNPEADIKGYDAARKLAILSSIAFNTRITPEYIHTEGIDSLELADIEYAKELGYSIKLVAVGKRHEDEVEVFVSPMLLKEIHPLAGIRGAFNAVLIEGNAVGQVMFYGPGAGKMPTASAVVADIMEAAAFNEPGISCTCFNNIKVMDKGLSKSKFYIRFHVEDRPGVLSALSGVFANYNISLAIVLQKNKINEAAEIVIVTYEVPYKNLVDALQEIKAKKYADIANVIRVEEES